MKMMKAGAVKNAYCIKSDSDMHCNDLIECYESLEEARSWADAFWESVMDDPGDDPDLYPQKTDFYIEFYNDFGVPRGRYPLFAEE